MRKLCFIVMAVVLMVGLILTGCAQQAPTTPTAAPTAPKTTAPPTTTAVKPVILRFNTFEPASGIPVSSSLKPWSEEVTKATGGRVVVELYTDATLGPAPAAWERLTTGVTDIEWFAPSQIAGRFPLHSIMNLPLMSYQSTKVSSLITWGLYQKFPEIKKEAYDQAHLLFLCNNGPPPVASVKKPIRVMADLKGLKLRVASNEAGNALTLLGGTAIFMPTPEVYLALERGILDGLLMNMIGWRGYKLYDLVKYVTGIWMTDNAIWATMNLNKWNSLPVDIQATIEKISERHRIEVYPKAGDTERAWGLNKYKTGEGGKEYIPMSDLETGLWSNTVRPILDKWAADITAKGFPGQAILDEAQRLALKYSAEYER